MGGTRSVRLKRPSVPFLALLLERDFFPPPQRRKPGRLYTSHRCLYGGSCLQKEAASPGQVLSRVLDSRVRTTSPHSHLSYSRKFDSIAFKNRKTWSEKFYIYHRLSFWHLNCADHCVRPKEKKKPFTRRFQRARAYIALYKLTQHRL